MQCQVCIVRLIPTHLKFTHKVELTPLTPTPNLNITPNPSNASNHCDSCSWTFKTRDGYISHLEAVHKMTLPKAQRAIPNPTISPDIDDPIFFCKSCQLNYQTRTNYRTRVRSVHKLQSPPLTKKSIFAPNISITDTQKLNNTTCGICKIKYSSRRYYQQHWEKFHSDG